jgi:hypothetical protein
MPHYPFCNLGIDAVTMRRDMPLGIPVVGLNQMGTRPPHQVHRSVEAGDHCESASKFGVVPSHFIASHSSRVSVTMRSDAELSCLQLLVTRYLQQIFRYDGLCGAPGCQLLTAKR